MLTRVFLSLVFALSGIGFLTGAWFSSFSPSAPTTEIIFAAQDVPIDDDIVGAGVDAHGLLDKAIDRLTPARTTWLSTKIRQTMCTAETCVVAEGLLQRGAHHCARLEMEIVAAHTRGRFVVVSDGDLLARVRVMPGAAPAAVLEKLPAAKEEHLVAQGCGGPLYLLRQLRPALHNADLQTGLLQDRPVIKIKGDLSADASPPMLREKTPPIVAACVYLDAKTLWPHRLEWWGHDKTRPILQIDFHDAEIDRELSLEECSEVFSYQPAGHEKVTEK